MSSSSRWPVVAAFAALGVSTQVCWLTYTAITTATAQHFGVDEQAVGWLANLFPLLFVALAVPTGLALDRWQRPTLAVGALLIAVGAAIRLVDDAYWAALVGQTLAAVAQPILANAITRIAATYLDPADRPLGIAVGAGATYLGMIAATAIGTVAGDVRTVVAIGTGISVVTAIAALLALRVRPPHRHDGTALPTVREVWRLPGVPVLSGIVFLGMGIFVALATWLEPLLAPAGLTADTTGLLLLVMLVAGVVGSIIVPPLAVRRGWEFGALRLTGVVTALACLLLGFLPLATGFVASVPIGFMLLSALPVALAWVERDDSPAAGPITSLIWMTGNAGGVVVSFVAGYLLPAPALAFTLFAALGLGAAWLGTRLQRDQEQVAGADGHDQLAQRGDPAIGQEPAPGTSPA